MVEILKGVLQMCALALTVDATIFLLKASRSMSAKDILEIAKPRWDYHSALANSLIHQKVAAKTGYIFLVFAFAFQALSQLYPVTVMVADDETLGGVLLLLDWKYLLILIPVFFVTLWMGLKWYNRQVAQEEKKVAQALAQRQ